MIDIGYLWRHPICNMCNLAQKSGGEERKECFWKREGTVNVKLSDETVGGIMEELKAVQEGSNGYNGKERIENNKQ